MIDWVLLVFGVSDICRYLMGIIVLVCAVMAWHAIWIKKAKSVHRDHLLYIFVGVIFPWITGVLELIEDILMTMFK